MVSLFKKTEPRIARSACMLARGLFSSETFFLAIVLLHRFQFRLLRKFPLPLFFLLFRDDLWRRSRICQLDVALRGRTIKWFAVLIQPILAVSLDSREESTRPVSRVYVF